MDNETAKHQKHGDEERQYVQDGRQKGQNGAPRGSTLNTEMVQKLSTFELSSQFFWPFEVSDLDLILDSPCIRPRIRPWLRAWIRLGFDLEFDLGFNLGVDLGFVFG